MAKIATIIKDIYANKYKGWSKDEKNAYAKRAQKTYENCLQSFDAFADNRNLDKEQRILFTVSIEENCVIECMVANPNNPQLLMPIARQTVGELYGVLFEKANPDSITDNILSYIQINTNSIENEKDKNDLLAHMRFLLKYYAIGVENDELQ